MKKTFKDFMIKDLDVFFNIDEMAEEHELEGETLNLVVENNLEDITGFGIEQLNVAQEMFKHYKTILVKATDFYIPKIDRLIVLDGEEYYVEKTGEEMGIIQIVVSANES
ncbi:hypothetical protein ACOMCU_24810 [Lysinibacillus sp. UGB7]|uniref:hypothetical protein n=1 Tax=Lysinibacillus sp. UGB7 TaxID=3411039 RepID=UPI003B7690F4